MAKQERKPKDASAEKDALELEKLKLELEELRHPVKASLRSFNWKDIVAIVLAVVGVFLLWQARVFDANRQYLAASTERLRVEKLHLERDNKELEETRSRLTLEHRQLEQEMEEALEQLAANKKEWEALKKLSGEFAEVLTIKFEFGQSGITWGFEMHPVETPPFGVTPETKTYRVAGVLDILQDVQSVSFLKIEDIALSDENVRQIATLRMNRLILSNNNLSDEMVKSFAKLSQVEGLSFSGNRDIRHPEMLRQMHKLTFLNLERTSFDDEGLSLIRHLGDKLEFLGLMDTEVSDEGLEHLRNFTALRELRLASCENITAACVAHVDALPQLQFLDLAYSGISEDDAKVLKEKYKNSSFHFQTGFPRLPQPKARSRH